MKEHSKPRLQITRRQFLNTSAVLGGTALWSSIAHAQQKSEQFSYPLNQPENQIYTVCLQCNTGCGIKVKLLDGVAVKIDGNPYAPQTLYPHLPFATPVEVAAGIDGSICPKGQAGLQTVYDPYRLRRVLKRAGKRGENKWMSIPFEQAIDEIVNGGYLFKHVPGEENRYVEGLKQIYALRDPAVAKQMASDLQKLRSVIKKVNTGQAPQSPLSEQIDAFKKKYADHLPALIDPDHPDLGPKNNQFVFNWGRLKAGREHLVRRFVQDAFGSVNAHGHTTVCQGSLYFTGKAMSEQWAYDEKSGEVKWTGGEKFYWQADTPNSEFLLVVGANIFEANYGPPARSLRVNTGAVQKIAVVDPRLPKTPPGKLWKWVPIQPGTEGALALGMIQWIIANRRYDARYLANANKAAAQADGEPNWCNATWLVKIDEHGNPGAFLRASEIGLAPPKTLTSGSNTYTCDLFVVMRDGQPVACDPNDAQVPVEGDLFVDTYLNGIHVKSALQLFAEAANERPLTSWANICGIQAKDIEELAREFTSHGKKAAADIHRGVSQHTNGFYNVLAWYSLNLLIGNFDWKGGMVKKAEWNITGDKPGATMPFVFKEMHPGKTTPFGISIIRHEVKYEETTLFQGYPAKRTFYPLSSDIYQEVIPSIGDAYPYPVKCLMLYMGSPVYALPAGDKLIQVLADVNRLPLFIAVDIVVGETSMYADYIFPDTTYLERWEFHGSHPNLVHKIQPVRQPAVPPVTETVRVFGEEMPISLEAVLLAIAEKLQLPGFGADGFGKGKPFTRPEDLYLKMVANIAAGEKPEQVVPDASDEEMQIFLKARSHLPASVFSPERWKQSVGEEWWRKVVYVLNRGGRFEDFAQSYTGEQVTHKYGKLINLYSEKAASASNSMTGAHFSGIARFYRPYTDCTGKPIRDRDEGYTLKLITYREILHTKSRTIGDYWLTAILPENGVLVNPADARRLGLKAGDEVRIVSASNPDGVWDLRNGTRKPIVGKVVITEGIKPGVVGFALGYGHWAYGSSEIVIDGKTIAADARRATGIHANAAMRADPVLQNTPLTDVTGGSVVFYDTLVTLQKT